MESWYRIQSALLAAIICGALAVHVLLSGRREHLMRRFAWFNLNLVAWFLVDALALSEVLSPQGAVGGRGAVASALSYTVVSFFADFAEARGAFARFARRWGAVAAVALFVMSVVGWPADVTVRQVLVAVGVLVALGLSAIIMYRRFRVVESRVDRARLKVLMVAGATVFALSISEYVPGMATTSLGNILVAVYMFFMFEVITLRRVLDLFEFLGRFVVLGGFAVVLSLIYALLVGWWRHDLGLFLLNTLIASIVILILFDPLRSFVEDKLNELVFREKFEFTEQAARLRTALARVIDVQELAEVVLRRLEASRRVTHASLWLADADGMTFSNLGFVGAEPPQRLDAIAARPFLELLAEEKLVAVENLEAERDLLAREGTVEDQARLELLQQNIDTMGELQAALCLAFVSGDQLLGFLSIKDERLRGAYSSEEIKALMAVAAQCTIAIESSRLVARMRERDRLAALGEMAAGLAHEIRNPLGAIKGAAQLLTGGDDELEQTYLAVIGEEVNRLNGVVSQFLSYARPLRGERDAVDVNEVIERTLTLLSAQEHPCEIDFRPAPNLAAVRADPEVLRQVVINLAQNAIQAMGEDGGTLTITTSVTWRRPAQGRGSEQVAFVRIRFQDEGPGIPPEVMERLFIPFFTTKAGGTGLGLAICQRLVRSMGGTIDVSSQVGQGAAFSVYLPTAEAGPRASVA